MVRINSREFRKILHKFFPLVTAYRYYISYEMCNDNNDTSIKSKFLFFLFFFISEKERIEYRRMLQWSDRISKGYISI